MKMNVTKFVSKKFVACAAFIAAGVTTAMAQGNGLAGINEATSMVTSYFEPGGSTIVCSTSSCWAAWSVCPSAPVPWLP